MGTIDNPMATTKIKAAMPMNNHVAERRETDRKTRLIPRATNPIEVPLFGAIVAGFVALGISRVFLSVSRLSATWLFIGIAAVIFVVAIGLSMVPKASKNVLGAVVALAAVAVLAGGILGMVAGEREFHDESEETTVPGEGGIGGRVYATTTTVATADGAEAKETDHGGE